MDFHFCRNCRSNITEETFTIHRGICVWCRAKCFEQEYDIKNKYDDDYNNGNVKKIIESFNKISESLEDYKRYCECGQELKLEQTDLCADCFIADQLL